MSRTFLIVLFFTVFSCIYSQDNLELKKMYDEDQNSRGVEKIDWDVLLIQDSTRRVEVTEMIKQNKVSTSMDYFHAAMIYQHGNDSTSYKLAWEYSKKAAVMDSTNLDARWLSAASYDRYLLSVGKPQIYGTQFLVINNKYYLSDIDTTKATDSIRRYFKTRTLNEIRDFLTKQNGEDNGLLIYPKSNNVKIIVK
ncbi:MAG: hypothetical protein M0P71_09265 [Melioribacteraceae bacterium]|nr:hypothetical protein [Melioribacteraceae bacterium]